MTKNKAQTARRIYGICLTALTIVVAVLFIVQIWLLFRATEESPYSVETVSERFSKIAIPFYLWLAAIVGGGVLSYLFPDEVKAPKTLLDTRVSLNRLKARLPKNAGGMVELKRENTLRKVVWGVCIALALAVAVLLVVFLLNEEYKAKFGTEFFKSHVEAEKLLKLFPLVVVALCACAGALIYQSYSLKKELTIVKNEIAESAKRGEKIVKTEQKPTLCDKIKGKFAFLGKDKSVLAIRLVVAVAGLTLFVAGICGDGMQEVLTKAINICTQCIGLG